MCLFVIPACGQKTSNSSSSITIGFLVKMPEEVWFRNEWKFARECAYKHGSELKTIGTPDSEQIVVRLLRPVSATSVTCW